MKAFAYAVAVALTAVCNVGIAQNGGAVRLHIASTSVAEAINQWAQQTGFKVVWTEDPSTSAVVPPLDGVFTPRQALQRLLKNTPLQAEFPDAHTAVISSSESRATAARRTHVRVADSASQARLADSSTEADLSAEVVVTAQKREEQLQDVPLSITVLDTAALAENGQIRLADYFATVPGLSLLGNPLGPGTQYLVIRGLSTGEYQNPTVATVIDDVPTGSSSTLAFGELSPSDIDPSDLDRIEVLKGPQGTLYGADTMGGLVKYVTKDPSTEAFSGRVEVGGVDIPNGGVGYVVRAAANIPTSDRFAVRASGYVRRDPGYIDDLTTGLNNVNSADVYGGHLAALWKLTEDLSLKVSGLVQQTKANGADQINSNSSGQPLLGDLRQAGWPGSGNYTTEDQLYSATLKDRIAGLDLVSVTGYGINQFDSPRDLTGFAASQQPPTPESVFGVPGEIERNHFKTEKFSQELRASSSIGNWFDWLAGAFYTHEASPDTFQHIYAANNTGAAAGTMAVYTYKPLTLSEYAVFADFTVHFTSQLDVQVGGRESRNKIAYEFAAAGPYSIKYYNVSPYVQPLENASGNAFTYLITPEFKFTPDLMVYARVATGYRIGGPNFATVQGIPTSYKPDRTTNYEMGVKGVLLDRRLTFDAAAYYIDWSNFQIGETSPNSQYYEGNAGNAKSEGIEASIQARSLKGLTITAQGSYNDAALTQNLPPAVVSGGTYGVAGDPLPYSVRWSGGITLNQDLPLSSTWTGFVGGAVTYLDSRLGDFASSLSGTRLEFPGYTTFNLRAGARRDSWLINLYVNNATNKRGIIGIAPAYGTTYNTPRGVYNTTFIQPRTIGIGVVYSF